MRACPHTHPARACTRSTLLALHRTAVLRHDDVGAETLLNLLLRNYLAYGLYDQVRCAMLQCAVLG